MEPAPGFKAKAIVDGEIVDVSADDYRGKWLVLLYHKVSICCLHVVYWARLAGGGVG